MRGFPLMNLLAVAAVLAALLVPLLRVDRPAVRPGLDDPSVAAEATVPVTLLVRGVHAPASVSITVAGRPVTLRGEGLERQGESMISLRDRALEFELKATWPAGIPATMLEVRAAPDGMAEQAQNVWAEAGAVDEILRFTWREKP